MSFQKNFWLLRFSLPSRAAERFGEVLGEEAAAVTVLAPPRHKKAHVEVLYNHKPKVPDISVKLAVLAAASGLKPPKFTIRKPPKRDWLKKVARDFPPLKIGRWTVHGAGDRKKVANRLYALQIDAESAFGTGEHPTTRGCLLMLDRILKTGFCPRLMADIGCGSGILAMACVQATGGKAVGVDFDPDSARIAAKNVRANGLGPNIRICRGCGYDAPLVQKKAPYDLIMANIFADPLCEMAKDLKKHLKNGGIAILSGLLTSQAKKVLVAHKEQRLILIDRLIIGEWTILALRRGGA